MTGDLTLRAISTGYTKAPILREVTLEVRQGEMVGVLGANGSGKTTLLRAVAGAIRTWSGTIHLSGQDLTRIPPWRRVTAGLSHVPEGRRILGPMTVLDNLRVAALAAGKSPPPVEDVFALFPRLADRAGQSGKTLSGGEQQMLAIARALMTRPSMLLVDELSSGLAPVITHELIASLRAICDDGVAMLIVEQSPHFVAGVLDRAYLLEHGSIVADGTLEELGGAERLADLYLGVHAHREGDAPHSPLEGRSPNNAS